MLRHVLPDSTSARALHPSRSLERRGDCVTGCSSGPVTATLTRCEPVCFDSVDIHVTCPSRFSSSRAEAVRTWMVWTDAGSCPEGPSREGPVCEVGLASDRERGSATPAWSGVPTSCFMCHGTGICSFSVLRKRLK